MSLRQRVESVVAAIPQGKVMSYGQIAALVGNPRAARIVGQIAHRGSPELPWHRVVFKSGNLSPAFSFGGEVEQARRLIEDGTPMLSALRVDMKNALQSEL